MKTEKAKDFIPRYGKDITSNWRTFGYLDSKVFIASIIICVGFILWGAVDHKSLAAVLDKILAYTVSNWGWMYQGGVFFFVIFCLGIAFSKYGKIKFGNENDIPEYSNFSWFAMLFGAGMGVGLVYWSVAEPIFHFVNNPSYTGVTSGSAQGADWAMAISFLHWGVSPWAIYVVLGIPMGLVIFRKGLPALVSSCFYPLLGHKIYGPIGKLIDIITLCITFFGVSATIGLGTIQLGAGLSYNYELPMSNMTYIIILTVVTITYLASACLPIEKGIKIGSNISMISCVALLVFIFVLGPTKYILDNFINAMGIYIQNFIIMSTWTDSIEQSGWLQSWTVFYWAMWIAWAPFVGMFIAKISKGRTIKEFVIAALVAPSLFDMIFFDIIGSSALHLEFSEVTKGIIEKAVNDNVANGIFSLFNQFPMSEITSPIILFVVFTFFVVSADSATIVLGMLSSGGDNSPKTSLKILWGVALAFSAGILIVMGGLNAVQMVAIVAVFPFIFIMFALCYSTVKMVKNDSMMLDTGIKKEEELVTIYSEGDNTQIEEGIDFR